MQAQQNVCIRRRRNKNYERIVIVVLLIVVVVIRIVEFKAAIGGRIQALNKRFYFVQKQ